MIANLHTHSIFSDGVETPEALVQMAIKEGIELLSLTDHNTFDGYSRFEVACREYSLKYVKGIEIEAIQKDFKYQMEVLAYFPNGGEERIYNIVQKILEERTEKVKRALERCVKLMNIDSLSYDEIKQMSYKKKGFYGYISNKMVYRYLLFKKACLPDYAACQQTSAWRQIWSMEGIETSYNLLQIIEAIKDAGGFAVIPHFGIHCKLDPDWMRKYEKEYIYQLTIMKEYGLWGIEMHPYRYLPQAGQINEIIESWAKKLSLSLTYGSDFHGGISIHNRFGAMKGDFGGFKG